MTRSGGWSWPTAGCATGSSSTWAARRTVGGTSAHTFDALRQARVERARTTSEHAAGVLVRPDRQLTVAGFLGEWLESKRGRRPATYQGYLHALRPVIQRYGQLPLQALDVPNLDALKRGMLSGELRRVGRAGAPLSARTVNYILTAVTSALRAALRRRLVAVNVGECVERVERDPDAGPERVGWQAEQVRAFLAHVRGHRLYGRVPAVVLRAAPG